MTWFGRAWAAAWGVAFGLVACHSALDVSPAGGGEAGGGGVGGAGVVPSTPDELAIDTSRLLLPSEIQWGGHGTSRLSSGVQSLTSCSDHFPPGSAAAAEIALAVQWYNDLSLDVVGFSLDASPHVATADMYADDVSLLSNRFDYVDEGFPCHKVLSCSDKYEGEEKVADGFSMNTCKCRENGCWGGIGKVVHFNIAVNSLCKDHFSDVEADDYPRAANIAHELGHAFGMIHTPSWPEVDRLWVSTMQGNQPFLSAYDVAYLHHGYAPGEEYEPAAIDLRVSTVTRQWKNPGESYATERIFFGKEHNPKKKTLKQNPGHWYATDNAYLDCATDAAPVFAMTWFNLGRAMEEGASVAHRLVLLASGGEPLPILRWRSAAMPALSQDSRVESISIGAAYMPLLSAVESAELRFEVDSTLDYDELDESNNAVSTELKLYPSRDQCPAD